MEGHRVKINKSSTGRRIISIALIALAAHLFLGLYPLPSQRSAEIDRMAEDAARISREFQITSPRNTGDPARARGAWADSLTANFWKLWVITLIGIGLSVGGAFMTLKKSRWWALAALAACLFFIALAVPPMLAMSAQAGGFFRWTSLTAHALLKDGVTFYAVVGIYNLFVLPIAYVLLSAVVIAVWVHERWHVKH
jgi:hypothetical protein